MKNLTVKPRSILRCINKYTKNYVEIPCPGGQGTKVRTGLMNIAFSFAGWSGITGNHHEELGDEIPKFHYYAMYDNKHISKPFCGIRFGDDPQKKDYCILVARVDLDTNEFIMTDELKGIMERKNIKDIYEYIDIDKLM